MAQNIWILRFRFLFACLCIGLFVYWEQPSIQAKFVGINIQTVFWFKSLVLLGSEFLLWLSLVLAARSHTPTKLLICTLALISALVFDVFYAASGKVIEYQDFMLLLQSLANTGDALAMYGEAIMGALLRSGVLIVGFVLMPPPPTGFKNNAFYANSIFVSLAFLVMATAILRDGVATNKLPAPISLYGLALAYGYDRLENPRSYNYDSHTPLPLGKSQYTHIILVVDESIRFDYSPFLRVGRGEGWRVMDYGRATSYANSSAVSNVMLRKGVRWGRAVEDFYQQPLIWVYAREAGYRSYLYDAQGGGRGHDYFDAKELGMVDANISRTDIRSDAQILDALGYLGSSQKSFTLIIKRGAHFPYTDHPKDYVLKGRFDAYKTKTPQRIAYLKSALYQSDAFWEAFFRLKITEPTLVIYTSDHGQNLQDREGLTHSSTQDPYDGEGLVPLVALSNIPDARLEGSWKSNANQSSHFNIPPTLLEAMGYDLQGLGYEGKSASLFRRIEAVGGFFCGIPFGYFGKEPCFKVLD